MPDTREMAHEEGTNMTCSSKFVGLVFTTDGITPVESDLRHYGKSELVNSGPIQPAMLLRF